VGLLAFQWKFGLKLGVVSISKLHNVDMVYIAFGGLLKQPSVRPSRRTHPGTKRQHCAGNRQIARISSALKHLSTPA
jgi:hypothetical protein